MYVKRYTFMKQGEERAIVSANTLRDVEKKDKDVSKHSTQHTRVCGLSLQQSSTESHKNGVQKFNFQMSTRGVFIHSFYVGMSPLIP